MVVKVASRAAQEVPPDPSALIESMRAFGYSLEAAVADLIDNSISAGAKSIEIEFVWDGAESFFAVVDDGHGMDEQELTQAMRLGSRSPTQLRAADDLGRFGLGLKSAGWSQGRSLTVVSKLGGEEAGVRRWDLDHVGRERSWSLLLSATEHSSRYIDQIAEPSCTSGTAVIVERLDRLVGDVATDDELAKRRFDAAIATTEAHIAMVFHRFLAGRSRLRITVNGQEVSPWDPFLHEHPATQRLQTDPLLLDGRRILVQPFVLPHASKLTAEEHAMAAGRKGWNAQQGFYVYRGGRMIVSGDWLGLRRMQQEEHYKLARIAIDVDNTMDEDWQIDVRKATARIPGALQRDLYRIAQLTRRKASDAYRFRGKTVARERAESFGFVWERVTQRAGAHPFRINRKHPVIDALRRKGAAERTAVDAALRIAEENLPVEAILMDAREHAGAIPGRPFAERTDEVSELLRQAHDAIVATGVAPTIALEALAGVEPFDSYPEVVEAFREEIGGAR